MASSSTEHSEMRTPNVGFQVGLAVVALFAAALAHGGGLDSEGGHTDRRTGEYPTKILVSTR